MNTIEALKANKVPFGLMEPELQEAAKDISIVNFDYYVGQNSGDWDTDNKDDFFRHYRTYRLRPDYEDEPDVVRCEVKPDNENDRVFEYNRAEYFPQDAFRLPYFIGFTAGEYLYGCLYRNKKDPTMVLPMILEKDLPLYEVLAPSSVLFRK